MRAATRDMPILQRQNKSVNENMRRIERASARPIIVPSRLDDRPRKADRLSAAVSERPAVAHPDLRGWFVQDRCGRDDFDPVGWQKSLRSLVSLQATLCFRSYQMPMPTTVPS